MEKRKQQAQLTRHKILFTALEILGKEGVHGMTTQNLIKRANISKGGLYHHFAAIEDVYIGILDLLIHSLNEEIFKNEFSNLQEFFDETINHIFKEFKKNQAIYAAIFYFISTAGLNPEYQKRLHILTNGFINQWAQKINYYSKKQISKEKLDGATRIIDMFFGGLYIHETIMNQPKKYKKITKEFMNMMIKYLEE